MKDCYTVREAADLCRTSVWTLYRRMREGELTSFRAGGGRTMLIPADSLRSFLDTHQIPASPRELQASSTIKVLIVDDDVELCSMLCRSFEREGGFQVQTANSGFQAGVALATTRPDIILLDIYLGDMDGRELFTHVSESEGGDRPRVIAISGYLQPDEVDELYSMGFDDYFSKPFRLGEITAQVKGMLAPQ